MLTVQFGNFSKRKNSTARPVSLAASFSVSLKENTSYDNPTFRLTATSFDYNYCKWDERYYFVVDIISERNNGWSVVCELDLMATYRTEILDTTAFIEYSAQGSTTIQDDRIVPTSAIIRSNASTPADFSDRGTYLFSCVGEEGVNTYLMDLISVRTVLNQVANWADNLLNPLTDIKDVVSTVGKNLISAGSAMECIRSVLWVPFPISDFPAAAPSNGISLGLYRIYSNFAYVTDAITVKTYSLTIPFTRSGFLRLRPYTEVHLYLPFVGNIVLDSPLFTSYDTIVIDMSRNNKNGQIAYQIFLGGVTIGTYGAETAVTVPVGISNITPQSLINSIGGAAIAAAYNPIGAVASAASLQTNNTCVGGIQGGAGAGLQNDFQVSVIERGVSGAVGNMEVPQGLPYFNTNRIGNISGYIKTRGASVSGTLHSEQYDRVNGILDAGAFIE